MYEKILSDAESVQKAVETVMGDYRESRNAIKVQLATDSNDFIQTQQFEKAVNTENETSLIVWVSAIDPDKRQNPQLRDSDV